MIRRYKPGFAVTRDRLAYVENLPGAARRAASLACPRPGDGLAVGDQEPAVAGGAPAVPARRNPGRTGGVNQAVFGCLVRGVTRDVDYLGVSPGLPSEALSKPFLRGDQVALGAHGNNGGRSSRVV
jgi:hypothetical protein